MDRPLPKRVRKCNQGKPLRWYSGRWRTADSIDAVLARARSSDRRRKRPHKPYKRGNNPIRLRLKEIKKRAHKQGVAFNLKEDWLLAHFSQGCEMTGVDLVMAKGFPNSAEIDRIKPGGDYTMDNCRVVCAIYNRAKWDWSDADVGDFASNLIGWRV